MAFRLAPARPAAVASTAMAATSQPDATAAALRVLERGGNAVDAALAAAAVLCVTEPMSTGIGGDAFALVWDGERLHGLDAAGPAPRDADPAEPVAATGPRSVTVPGAVAGWAALASRFGRLGLDTLLADAIAAAEEGFAVQPITAAAWLDPPPELGPIPAEGDLVRLPELGATLRRIAGGGPDVLYRGEIARADRRGDLARGGRPGRLRAALGRAAGGRLPRNDRLRAPAAHAGGRSARGARAARARRAGAAARRWSACASRSRTHSRGVRDGAEVGDLLEPEALARRRLAAAPAMREPAGGTVYLCTVDGDGMAVSFIQSLFEGFGSRRRRARAPASSSRTAAPASPCRARSSRVAVRTTRSSRGCSSATGRCSGRSASWAASSRPRRTSSSSPRSSTTGSTRRPPSTARASASTERRPPRGGPVGAGRRGRGSRPPPRTVGATTGSSAAARRSCGARQARRRLRPPQGRPRRGALSYALGMTIASARSTASA